MIQGIILAIISATAYATLPIFGKLGYESGMDTIQMLTHRFLFGALTLFLFMLFFNRKALIPSPKLLIKCAVLGICLYTLQAMMFFRALKYIPASTTSLILYLYPLIVLFESIFFLKDKFKASSFISVVLIMGGCCLVFYDAFSRELNLTGILLATGAAFSFGTYLTMSQVVLRGENSSSVAFYMVTFTAIAYVFINGGLGLEDITMNQVAVSFGLGVVPSAIAVLLLYMAIDKIGAAYTSIFSSIEPIATLLMAAWLLSEKIVVYQIYGVALLTAGIVIPNLKVIISGK